MNFSDSRPKKSQWFPRLIRLALLLLSVLGVVVVDQVWPSWKAGLDEYVSDLGWRMVASKQSERRVVLVDIGESSLREFGPWPWPRSQVAALSQKLAAYGVGKQIFDIVFEAPREGDDKLAAALSATPSVIAQIFVVDHGVSVASGTLRGGLVKPPCPADWAQAIGYVAPAAALGVGTAGHITPRIDDDGAVRRMPAMVCYQGAAYPALALSSLMPAEAGALRLLPGDGWLEPAYRLSWPHSGEGVPVAASGDVRIPYRIHPDGVIAVAASDVLAGRVPDELLRGAMVVIGSTALGINDAVPTPFSGATAGMLIHAELLAGLLDQRIPYTPKGAALLQVLMLILLSGGLLVVAGRTQRANVFLPLLGLLGACLVATAHVALLLLAQMWVGWVLVAAPLLLAALLLAVYEHWRSRSERERLYSHLSSYLPAAVANVLAGQQPSDRVQAERREVTVLIADIRNFSAYCESAPAEEVAAVLHAFIITAQQVIEEQGGVVEAVQGDSVLALWPQPDIRAVAAAQSLQARAPQFLPDSLPENLAPLALGVGVEAGFALVGSIGPKRRRTHAAMGATVTTASRLQAMTADLAEDVLIGPVLAQCLPPERLRGLGQFLLEGMRRPKSVFALVN